MTTRNGGFLLARALRNNSVDTVFALHGGHLDTLLFGLEDHRIRIVDVRHEAAAVHAADGYSRATGRLGVSVVTSGPGVTNAVTGAAVAYVDSVPQVIIGGAPPMRDDEKFVLQSGIDQCRLMQSVTKQALRVTDIDRVPEYVDMAIRAATRGRPGPVYLEVPIDVMFDRVGDSTVPFFPEVRPFAAAVPSAEVIEEVSETLRLAARPILVCGHGVQFGGAQDEVRELAERFDVPVFGNSRARGVLPFDHELNGGNVARLASLPVPPDVVLVLGARLSHLTFGNSGRIIGPETTVVHVDASADEAGRNFPVDIAVNASVREFAKALASTGPHGSRVPRGEWLKQARECFFALNDYAAAADASDQLHPYALAKEITEAAEPDAIFVGDGSETYNWFEPLARTPRLGHWLSHGYYGCLGIGSPYAVGAQVARPDKQVIQVVGDGSVGFNIQEFDTMVRHDLPIITIVNSNGGWGSSRHMQTAMAGRTVASDLPDTNYHEVMVAFGGYGEIVRTRDEVRPAFLRAVASGRPACITAITDPSIVTPRLQAMMDPLDQTVGNEASIPEESAKASIMAMPYYQPVRR